jgi:cytochrome b561
MKNSTQLHSEIHYSIIAKLFHWGFVILFGYGVIKQVDNIGLLEDSALLHFEMIFALIFLVLLVVRWLYMNQKQQSVLSNDSPKWQILAAKIVHYGMYISLAMIAISGLMIGALFSLVIEEGLIIDSVLAIHEISVTASYWFIGLHILAALYHRLLKDGIWSTMVPLWKE